LIRPFPGAIVDELFQCIWINSIESTILLLFALFLQPFRVFLETSLESLAISSLEGRTESPYVIDIIELTVYVFETSSGRLDVHGEVSNVCVAMDPLVEPGRERNLEK
jgi:hypothetical protein